jgi:hypothetical protein
MGIAALNPSYENPHPSYENPRNKKPGTLSGPGANRQFLFPNSRGGRRRQ